LYTAADFELDERHMIKNEKVALDRLWVQQNIFLVSFRKFKIYCLGAMMKMWESWEYFSLTCLYTVHVAKMCSTVKRHLHWSQVGGCSLLRRYEWVRGVWPMKSLFKIVLSLAYDWCEGEKCWSLGNTLQSLLLGLEFQMVCHLEKIILLRVGIMSGPGTENLAKRSTRGCCQSKCLTVTSFQSQQPSIFKLLGTVVTAFTKCC